MAARIPPQVLETYPHAADLADDLSESEFDDHRAAKAAAGAVHRSRLLVLTGLPIVPANKLTRLKSVVTNFLPVSTL